MDHFGIPRRKRHKTIVGGEEDAILDSCKGKITRIIDRASQANRDFDRPLHVLAEERDNGESAPIDIASRLQEISPPESPRMLQGVQDLVWKDRRDAKGQNSFEEVGLQPEGFITIFLIEEPLHGYASVHHGEAHIASPSSDE